MSFHTIPDGVDVLEPWQAMYAGNGIQAVGGTVPPRPPVEGEVVSKHFVLDRDEVPVGLLSVIDMGRGIVEFGARFWEQNPRIALLLDEWMRTLLNTYSAVVVRCYSTNSRVKKLVQRTGFRLFRIEKPSTGRGASVEFYIVTPDTYLGRE